MEILPLLSLVATAGILAFLSPCSYAMLPAYVGFFLSSSDGADPSTKNPKLATGLKLGFSVVSGFAAVLIVLWIVFATLGNVIGRYLPQVALVVGILLAIAGLVMLFKPTSFHVPLPKFMQRSRGGFVGGFLFGVAYIIGGLGCTLPIFAAVLAQAATLGVSLNILAFVTFFLALAIPMMLITALLTVAKASLFKRIKKTMPYVARFGAALLVVAGIVLIYRELPFF